MVAAAAVLIGLAVLCLGRAAKAQVPAQPGTDETAGRRVLLLSDKPTDPFVDRLRNEIASLGLTVLIRNHSGMLEDEARANHAVAAIRVLPSHNGVEVWMAETSGRSLLRQLIVDERPGGPDLGLIALQTVELLRTSLLPNIPAAPAPPPAPAPAPTPAMAAAAPVPAPPAPTGPSMAETGVQAGLGTLYSPSATGPSLQGWVSLHQFWSPHLGLALNLSFPILSGSLSGPEGSAHVGAYLGGLELVTRLKPEPGLFANAGAALSAVWLLSRGDANRPLNDQSSSAVVATAHVGASIGWSGSFYKVGVLALAGAAVQRVTIRFAGNEAGRWGWPLLGAFLTGELDWH